MAKEGRNQSAYIEGLNEALVRREPASSYPRHPWTRTAGRRLPIPADRRSLNHSPTKYILSSGIRPTSDSPTAYRIVAN